MPNTNSPERHGMHSVSPEDTNLSTEEQNYRKFKKIIENGGGSVEMFEQARDRRDIAQEQCFELVVRLLQREQEKNIRLEEKNKMLEAELVIAHTNETTKLPNRMALEKELTNWIAELKESNVGALMVFAFDVDSLLKKINDEYGHSEGDRLLNEFGEYLKGIIKSGDLIAYPESMQKEEEKEERFVAHPHGDEFRVVLRIRNDLSLLTSDELKSFFKKIHDRIYNDINAGLIFTVGAKEFRITASVGSAQSLPGEKTAEELINEADKNEREDKKRRKEQEDYSI